MAGVGRDLCGSSSPTPAEAGSPGAGCTGLCPGDKDLFSSISTSTPWEDGTGAGAACNSLGTYRVHLCRLFAAQNGRGCSPASAAPASTSRHCTQTTQTGYQQPGCSSAAAHRNKEFILS